LVSAEIVASGSNIAWTLTGLKQGLTQSTTITPATATGTLLSATVGDAFMVQLNPAGGLANSVVGHAAGLEQSASLSDLVGPFAAWAGETADARFTRLCTEQGIASVVTGTAGDSAMVGPQTIDQFTKLLQDCEDADQGLLYEPRDQFGLAYRVRASMY